MGAMSVEEATFLYALTLIVKPQVTLETGFERGWSTAHLALGCKHNGFGKVISIESSEESIKLGTENLIREGLSEWVSIIHGDARTEIEKLPDCDIPQLALIDTSIPLRMAEVKAVAAKMRSGSIIAVHDVSRLHPMRQGHQILDDLIWFSTKNNWSLIDMPSPRGLAILQRH